LHQQHSANRIVTFGGQLMSQFPARYIIAVALACCLGNRALAAFPFLEDFTNDAANWTQSSGGALLNHVASGGPNDDPYVTRNATLPVYQAPGPMGPAAVVVFRGEQTPLASNGGFNGNWLAAGIRKVTAYVRHDAGVPLSYTFRFADPNNSPGASYVTDPVPSGMWTKLSVDVTPTSPQWLTYGAGTHATVFDNIGRIQISAIVPVGSDGTQSVAFDLDRVTVAVPEPATLVVGATAAAGLALAARRRRR
jgi:hypothetical protein